MNNFKDKIQLSKILEEIEVNRSSKKNVKLLDQYHSNPKSHVIGITGPPGVGKSTLIDKLITILRKDDELQNYKNRKKYRKFTI